MYMAVTNTDKQLDACLVILKINIVTQRLNHGIYLKSK